MSPPRTPPTTTHGTRTVAFDPLLGHPKEVAEGVWLVAIPLVGTSISSVNVYLVRHADGVLLIDAGYDHPTCRSALDEGLVAAGATAADVTAIVLTHNHPDHVGLASAIRRESGAWVAIHPLDALNERQALYGTFLEQLEVDLTLAGVPEPELAEMVEASRLLSQHAHDLTADRFLDEATVISTGGLSLEVVPTPGHTRGHVSLFDRQRRILFGGDLLLDGGGEVQLGVVVAPDDDPVRALEGSLSRVSALDVDLVLPGHWAGFADLSTRAQAAATALRDRVTETAKLVRMAPGATAWELAPRFNWGRPWAEMGLTARRFAVMQAIGFARRAVSLGSCASVTGSPERYFPQGD